LRAEACEVLGGMIMANTAKITRAVDLTVSVSSTIAASHRGVVNSIAIVKNFLRRSIRVGGGRWARWFLGCNRWFGVFLFDKGEGVNGRDRPTPNVTLFLLFP
jgi:hypothetical protein